MYKTCNKDDLDSLPTGVYEITGEPAILINGLPPISATDDDMSTPDENSSSCPIVNGTGLVNNQGLGELLVGREVQKLFGNHLYRGTISEFDREYGWYKVEYEDGDFEDLEWDELVKILQPLDISAPIKTIFMKVPGKKHKSVSKSAKRRSRTKHDDVPNSNTGGELKKPRDA
ncbi:transporter [Lithospermum erythrorhizon]|uniref:Transporter n=1 Tax=Lithospermum erythrorhizon TaxID=34254 RepID=A0AAV3QLY6_LITER